RCTASRQKPAVPQAAATLRAPEHWLFDTDAGLLRLTLDPSDAPLAATRMHQLLESGFFNGQAIHRAGPGFVAQLGDPGGDGYGGAPLPPLPAELAPDEFEPGAIGVAGSERESGSSQIFVTLGRYPHLDGEQTRIGVAGPGWEKVIAGDL